MPSSSSRSEGPRRRTAERQSETQRTAERRGARSPSDSRTVLTTEVSSSSRLARTIVPCLKGASIVHSPAGREIEGRAPARQVLRGGPAERFGRPRSMLDCEERAAKTPGVTHLYQRRCGAASGSATRAASEGSRRRSGGAPYVAPAEAQPIRPV